MLLIKRSNPKEGTLLMTEAGGIFFSVFYVLEKKHLNS